MRYKKYNILELREFRSQWESIKTELWNDEQRQIFENRKKAIDMYIDNISVKEIFEATGIRGNKIAIYIERCVKINNITGSQYGYAALIPNKKLNQNVPPKKETTSSTKGAFKALLLNYPVLDSFIKNNYFHNANATLEKNISPVNLYRKFLEECKKQQIQDYEYPFNTVDNARRTFYTYLKQLDSEYANLAIKRESVNARQKFLSTGNKKVMRPSPLAPFSVVQIDGHKIDMLYTVEVINKHGEIVRMPAMRMWLIAVIDVATRAIVGYSLTSNENYNQTDILRAIRNSIMPKTPMKFSLSGIQYPDNYGYPSLAVPETEWAIPCTIMLDNAKSHLAQNVINKLCNELFCSLNFGSVATPETRGIVERMFKTLEDNGYHRMVSTTGSNINDIKRENAEKDAVKYQITYNDIVQLTEYFIAIYNNSPHSALDNQTPIECMKRRVVDAGMQPCIANATLKRRIYDLTNITEIKNIRGSFSNGKRPYITYKGVEYRNDILSQSMGLIGKKIIIEINPDDISTIKGYFEDGTELGILYAVGEWGKRSHSLKTREEAIKFANHNKQKNNPFYAPLTELENELNERAENERRARTKAARIRTEQDKKLADSISNSSNNVISLEERRYQNNKPLKISDDEAIRKKLENYTKEEMEAIVNAGSLEDAFKKGLI